MTNYLDRGSKQEEHLFQYQSEQAVHQEDIELLTKHLSQQTFKGLHDHRLEH